MLDRIAGRVADGFARRVKGKKEPYRMPRIDVIIPAYNAAKYVAAAIESVLAQTYSDWRVLVVDDGSTDETAAVVAPYVDRSQGKIEYIKRINGGVSAARNTGILNSSAEYLAMLDADDIWLPCRLAESLKVIEARPQIGLTYGFISRIDQDGKFIDSWDRGQQHGEGQIAPYIYMKRIDLPTVTVMVRRKCIEEVGMFDESLRITEDRDLWYRISLRYEVALVPKVLAYYRVSPNSITTDTNKMLKAQLQFIDKHYGANGCGLLRRRMALARVYKQRAEELGRRGEHGAALASALRGVAFYPLDISTVRTAASLLLHCAGLRG
jgi:glycosyltransferase involved in cell wall biosynthesis